MRMLAVIVLYFPAFLFYTFDVQAQPPAGFYSVTLILNLSEPTSIEFAPDGRMFITERRGKVKVVQPGATTPDTTPVITLTNFSDQQGILDIALDPNFASNNYFYLFYSTNSSSMIRDRVSRFTLTGNTASQASEVVIWQHEEESPQHHGGTVAFGPDGKVYISTGDGFDATPGSSHASQRLDTERGKILRLNPDGSIPTDNPFYDGAGANKDTIWALGLRNAFRMTFDPVTGAMYIADVGGNDKQTAIEEINLGAAGANYGWPICEGTCATSGMTNPIHAYPHNGRDASITGGFVYRGTMFPLEYWGNYFYGDYVMNWVKRLAFNQGGGVSGDFAFEPADGTEDGPYGDIVDLKEGPEGALYYVDIGISWEGEIRSGTVRRIRYSSSNQPPTVTQASAAPTQGPGPELEVTFDAAATDPEGETLSYAWDFGDGATASQPNVMHTYSNYGQYVARLTVTDSEHTVFSDPITIQVGTPPTATINTPAGGAFFRAGDVIAYSGEATDPDGELTADNFSWTIIFHHESHTHPVAGPLEGITEGTFVIPTSGHDFSGNTSYRIVMTVTDAHGLTSTDSVVVSPEKVNLTFQTDPTGLLLNLDQTADIATPFVKDALIGFEHAVEAPLWQAANGRVWNFSSWSDGGVRQHVITTPASDTTYTAMYTENPASALSFDGINDGVASVNLPLSSQFTYEAWVKRTADFNRYETVMTDANVGFTQAMFTLYIDGNNQVCSGAPDQFTYYQKNDNVVLCSGITADIDKWHHLAVVRDSLGARRFFVDGVLTSTQAGTRSPTDSNGRLWVGRSVNGSPFGGYLDEVRISKTAVYTANFTPSKAPLSANNDTVLLFHFDEGSGQGITDSSGNKRHGLRGISTSNENTDPTWILESPVTKP